MSRPPGRWLFPLRRGVRRMVAEIRAAMVREDALVLESIGPRHGAAPRASLCILAHFDPHGVVDPYVVHYVRALDALGSDVIVVSTSPRPIVSEAEKLLPYCRQVVRRRNIGLDFGSWKLGLRLVGDVRHDRRVILANDSVYGPLHPLAPLFEQMPARGFDLWGMTDSAEIAPHLQSYFLVFERSALESPFFHVFWDGVRY